MQGKTPDASAIVRNLAATTAAAVAIAIVGVAVIRECLPITQSQTDMRMNTLDPALVTQWMEAVTTGGQDKALLLARRIATVDEGKMPPLSYIKMFSQYGISSRFLTSDFSPVDFTRWRDAIELQTLYERITTNSGDRTLSELFTVVNAEISHSTTAIPTATTIDIWKRRKGGNEDKIRLMAGLAACAGYHAEIIYLLDKKRHPLHLLLELRNNNRKAVVDFKTGTLWTGGGVDSMPVPDNWPLELKNAMGSGKVRMLPREAQDYRDANILLYRRISAMTTKLPAP